MTPIKNVLLVSTLSLLVLSAQQTQAEVLVGLGLGGTGLSGDGDNLSDVGFGSSFRLGYLRANDRIYADAIQGEGLFGSALDGSGIAYDHYSFSYDYLAKSDNAVFQAFIGPHAGWVKAKSCYDESPLVGANEEQQCKTGNGLAIGAQLGVILQAAEVFGLELGYRHSLVFGLETKVTDAKNQQRKDTLKQISYGYLGINVSF